jgi:NAD-dependent SIR2 family protein deacetylase
MLKKLKIGKTYNENKKVLRLIRTLGKISFYEVECVKCKSKLIMQLKSVLIKSHYCQKCWRLNNRIAYFSEILHKD